MISPVDVSNNLITIHTILNRISVLLSFFLCALSNHIEVDVTWRGVFLVEHLFRVDDDAAPDAVAEAHAAVREAEVRLVDACVEPRKQISVTYNYGKYMHSKQHVNCNVYAGTDTWTHFSVGVYANI